MLFVRGPSAGLFYLVAAPTGAGFSPPIASSPERVSQVGIAPFNGPARAATSQRDKVELDTDRWRAPASRRELTSGFRGSRWVRHHGTAPGNVPPPPRVPAW